MNYEISLSEDGQYIRIHVSEVINSDLQRRFAKEAIAEARRHSVRKFFVDVHVVRNVATVLDQYLFAHEDMEELALDRSSKIAVYIDREDTSHDFIETVFQNAGVNCRIFKDESLALQWLAD